MRVATGVALVMEGPNTRMVVNGVSKRQTAVSHSTPEVEIVAVDYAVRAEGVPALSLISAILERPVRLHDGGQRSDDQDMSLGQEPYYALPQPDSKGGCSVAHGGIRTRWHQYL
jgi:hypothetical protein